MSINWQSFSYISVMTVEGFISVKEKSVTFSSYISPADIVSNVIAASAVYPKNIKKTAWENIFKKKRAFYSSLS